MSFINDLKNAIDNYETDNCNTQILSYSLIGAGQTVLNVGDRFRFKVKVTNQSHLDMVNVRVRIVGSSHASLEFPPFWWETAQVNTPAFSLPAHQTYTTGYYYGRAKVVTSGVEQIVTARINSWDASLHHLLYDHTGYGAKEGKLNKQVYAD